MANWKFKPMSEDDMSENPTQEQFFTTDGLGGNMANAMVREGIQNALDEPLDATKPVVVKIFLSGEKYSLMPDEYRGYVDELQEHLEAEGNGLRDLPDFKKDKLGFILFEDFNTKGLRGEPLESKDREISDENKPHNFFYFWRNVGISGKAKDKLGRWGVGKTVFPAVSRINTFWGYTIQCDTGNELLMGQSVIKKHNLVSEPQDWGYRPYGYYGLFDQDKYFAKPMTDETDINKFKRDFNISRIAEPGLSVVAPFYKSEISLDALTIAVLQQYFYPILKGTLVVELRHEDDIRKISKENLTKLLSEITINNTEDEKSFLDKDSLASLFDFTQWAIDLPEDKYSKLKEQKPQNQPRWNSNDIFSVLDQNNLIAEFEKNKRLAFKVPVKFQGTQQGSILKTCWIKVFLEKNENLLKPEDHFIRENITIVDVTSLKSPFARSIVLIEDMDLANLLGDAENPAHTQWQKDSPKFANKYIHGSECLQFISNAPQRLYNFLQKPAVGLDKEILKHVFFLKNKDVNGEPVEPDDDSKKDKPKPTNPNPIIPPLDAPRHNIRSQKIDGGIRIYATNLDVDDLPKVNISLAYMTTRGKPLKKYQSFDFEVNKSPISLVAEGCKVINLAKNEIELEVEKIDFEVFVTGFDPNRDLFVKLNPQYAKDDKEI